MLTLIDALDEFSALFLPRFTVAIKLIAAIAAGYVAFRKAVEAYHASKKK